MNRTQRISRTLQAGWAIGPALVLAALAGCKGKIHKPKPPRHSVAL